MKDYFNDLKNKIPNFSFNFLDFNYPPCMKCCSILLISKIDSIKSTINYTCENCFKENKTNYKFINFLFRQFTLYYDKYSMIQPIKLCKEHEKPITYFCKTCMRSNCENCKEKQK